MKDIVKSAIYGCAIGDALGVAVEFSSREELIQHPVTTMMENKFYETQKGEFSDDTSMILCTLDSLANGYNLNEIMDKFVLWKKEEQYTASGVLFDEGMGCQRAINKYISGEEPIKCGGTKGSDNGNGSLMRIMPICLYVYFNKLDALKVEEVSKLTHAHKRSLIACVMYYFVIANLLEDKLSLNEIIQKGINDTLDYYNDINDYDLNKYNRLFEFDKFIKLEESKIKSSGYVVDSLEAALYCLGNTDSYNECVLKAVNLGEDTDTVACIAGGIAGLYYGYNSIKKEWINDLMNKELINYTLNKFINSLNK